jgi:DNA-binding transcriptional ArsR family regulator
MSSDDEARLDRLFQALADPNRRRVLALLRETGEMRVGDIAAAFDMSLNGVSKHLKVLEKAGLVVRRREGTAHLLSIDWRALGPLVDWLDVARTFWDTRLDALAMYLEDENEDET